VAAQKQSPKPVCVECGAPLAINPCMNSFQVHQRTPYGQVRATVHVEPEAIAEDSSITPALLCDEHRKLSIQSGFELMAVTLNMHVWDEGVPFAAPEDSMLFLPFEDMEHDELGEDEDE